MIHDGAYYDLPTDCQTLTDVIVKREMCYPRGNMFKAIYRWDLKGVNDDPVENIIYNLEKNRWYTDYMLKIYYAKIDPRRVLQMQENEIYGDRS